MRIIVPGERVKVTNRFHPRGDLRVDEGNWGSRPKPPWAAVNAGNRSAYSFWQTYALLIGHWPTTAELDDVDHYLWKGGWPCGSSSPATGSS